MKAKHGIKAIVFLLVSAVAEALSGFVLDDDSFVELDDGSILDIAE